MEEAKRARKAETPKRPSRHLRSSAPYFYPTPHTSPHIGYPGLLLVWEHRLISPDNPSKLDIAFFRANSLVSVSLMIAVCGGLI